VSPPRSSRTEKRHEVINTNNVTTPDRRRALGASDLIVSPLGVGTNRWSYGHNDDSVLRAFSAFLDNGINFFDTAEVYGRGTSETLLGTCLKRDERPVSIASKFAPWPTRFSRRQFMGALDASLRRLGVPVIDLYYIHWPFTYVRVESLMEAMAQAVEAGKIRAVGVSNFSAVEMRRAADRLAHYNIPLAANEVHYSLAHRRPEVNGVLDACRELRVALVAYRPLEGGSFTSAFTPNRRSATAAIQQATSAIARERGVGVSQVTLNWLLRRDPCVIPIPGATSAGHAQENAATLSWEMSDEEFAAIDRATSPNM
jgi:aryl-alcohol dehydrogenase-like predicted oxidoreductase